MALYSTIQSSSTLVLERRPHTEARADEAVESKLAETCNAAGIRLKAGGDMDWNAQASRIDKPTDPMRASSLETDAHNFHTRLKFEVQIGAAH